MTTAQRIGKSTSLLIIVLLAGCERPPVPASTQPTGPPAAAIIDPKSEQGKQLLAERKKFHDTFVPEKAELPPAAVNKPTAPAPVKQPVAAPQQPTAPQPAPIVPAPPADGAKPPPTAGAQNTRPAEGTTQISADEAARRKGRELGNGLIATPIGAYLGAKERVKLIQFESELSKWVTTHDRKPRDFAELNEQVLKPANIALPQLRAGEKYVFDPKQGQYGILLVEQPAPK